MRTPGALSIEEFGERLIETQDLDPLYTMLHAANLGSQVLQRFVLGYSMFYHAGAVAKVAEQTRDGFWNAARQMITTGTSWRGSERRHFRGSKAMAAIDWMAERYPLPEDVISHWWMCKPTWPAQPFDLVTARVKAFPMYGPWISFKVADLLDRVLLLPVDWSTAHLNLYDAPAAGLRMAAQGNETDQETLQRLLEHFRQFQAPPSHDRQCGVAEVETVLCKWHSYKHGHYPLGKDTKEIAHHLHHGPESTLAGQLLAAIQPYEAQWC